MPMGWAAGRRGRNKNRAMDGRSSELTSNAVLSFFSMRPVVVHVPFCIETLRSFMWKLLMTKKAVLPFTSRLDGHPFCGVGDCFSGSCCPFT